jgi:DNA repair photolyase
MRWDEQRVEREREGRLPGIAGATGVVRTFEEPEALGVRFHEVEARSALNRVSGSYLPFNWTVNPYRGCAHACTYCLERETPVLMADGRTKPIAELQVGDRIYGTVRDDRYRRYAVTEVLAHWESFKEAHRVTLEDGTELIASSDHRFWTGRGKWKHVVGAQCGPMQRPHLTLNDKLVGTGGFSSGPDSEAPVYRRGYLCGLIRGDGHVGSYSYKRLGRNVDDHRFRLALTDIEPLRRAREYLVDIDVVTEEFDYRVAIPGARAMTAIRASAREKVAAVRQVTDWPRDPTDEWCKGFLAGIFDAEGSSSGVIRICNTDPAIIDWTRYCLRRFDFNHVVEDRNLPNGVCSVRILGGLREALRFFHVVDPATTRKRTIESTALKSDAKLGIVAIEPAGKRALFDITTGTGDFIANGVVSHNCFARQSHTYLDLNAAEDFEREIVVKVNVPELLRAEVSKPSWKRELVAFGTNTDPYQWVESKYELMPPMLEALRDTATPTSVLSKSPLPLRDLELLKQIGEVAEVSVNFSVPTLDEKAWRETEPHTPHPRKRLEAVAKFNEAGIPSGVLVAPLMPGINDQPEQVREIVSIAEQAGASFISGIGLHLRPGVKEVFMGWLRSQRPDLVDQYEELYQGRAYLRPEDRREIDSLVQTTRGRPARRRRDAGRNRERQVERPSRRQPTLF